MWRYLQNSSPSAKQRNLLPTFLSAVNPWARFLGALQRDNEEVVMFELRVEVPQRPVNDIRPAERLATLFEDSDEKPPEILALREDFPSVPHLNLSLRRLGPSLCLYDEPWAAIRLSWTAAGAVERLRNWLRLTAIGELHGDDQPLEPLILTGSEKVVLPPAVFETDEPNVHRLSVQAVSDVMGRTTFIATDRADTTNSALVVGVTVSCPPQQHGVISLPPVTLFELHSMLARTGFDLISELRMKFREWVDSDNTWLGTHTNARVLLIVRLPKMRNAGGPPVTTEVRAFLTGQDLGQVGADIGVWQMSGGKRGFLLEDDTSRTGQQTTLAILDAMPSLTREFAAQLNREVAPLSKRIVAIGVGALGSQVFLNCIRSGFGRWTLIDEDRLLPHNPARHVLPSTLVGHAKATGMLALEAALFVDDARSAAIVADILSPPANAWDIAAAMDVSDVILDMSASVAVARHLARDVTIGGRRASIFLNPRGDSVTALAEDKDRKVRLDALEMQFYRLLLREPKLSGYMADATGRIRPGLSCRDVTSTIPQDMVAILSGIAGRALKRLMMKDAAAMAVWTAVWTVEVLSLGVQFVEAAPQRTIIRRVGGWTVVTDEGLVQQVDACREASLPNETGGVLLGQYDMSRRIIYVFDMLPAPADSERWPTAYIRGSEGLLARVKEARKLSGDMADYVGEWHSHPKGISTSASPDDVNVLRWVSAQKARDGHPGLVMIVGDDRRVNMRVLDRPLRVA